MSGADLLKLNIRAIHQGLKSKSFTAEELTLAFLNKIEERNSVLNAYITVDKNGALECARSVDAKLLAGEEIDSLAGVPCSIKDLLNTKGLKTTCGSQFLKNFVPPYDASVVRFLRQRGAVILGKVNLDEFACGSSTEHSFFGVTRNPYDLDRVAGGSSGGSAAAVADDLCVYSIGTDTGGSIRQPASLCGVYGFKVTYGRVSRSGVTAMASSWDTVGPFTRDLEDMAYVLQAISGKDEADSTTLDVPVPDYADFFGKGVKGIRVGVPKEYFAKGLEAETEKLVLQAVEKLRSAGALIEEVSLPMTKYALAVYYVSAPAELSANLERFDGIRFGEKAGAANDLVDYYFEARAKGFGDEIKRRIMIGTYVLSAGYFDAFYKKAQKVRTLIIDDFAKAFANVDVLVAPVSPFPAFKIGELANDPLAMYMADVLTIPVNAAGLPALSCPIGLSSNGLPVGMQVIAPQFGEGLCLQVADVLR